MRHLSEHITHSAFDPNEKVIKNKVNIEGILSDVEKYFTWFTFNLNILLFVTNTTCLEVMRQFTK